MSATPRIECPHCRQSIKRPPLAPGEKCLCPKCNQPFTLGADGAAEAASTAPPGERRDTSGPSAAAPAQAVVSRPVAAAPRLPTAATQAPSAPAFAGTTQTPPNSTPSTAAAKPPEPKRPPPSPPPPKKKVEVFGFHCFLCGSLLHAKVEQVGTKIKCHDCHAENEVRAPKRENVHLAAEGPSLDDAEDFGMSAVVERPKYSPIERPRREDDEEDEFRLEPIPVAPTQPITSAPEPRSVDAGMVDLFSQHGGAPPPPPVSSAPMPPQPTAAPAIPRPDQFLPPPSSSASAAPQPKPPRVRQNAESYGDELWGGATDPSRPAFERSPFLVGILEFLLYPGTLPRWLTLTALASIPIAIIQMATSATGDYHSVFSAGVMTLLMFAAITGVPFLGIFGAHAMSIVQDTGRGREAIEDWPLGGIFPRGNPLFLPIAAALGAVPGLLIWALYYLPQEGVTIRIGLMMLVSTMLFMPLVWLPMLLEKSLQGPLNSPTFWHSFKASGQGWITFYVETLFLALIAYGGMSLWSVGSAVIAPLSATILIVPLFLYFRLVGRLLWYIDPAMAPPPPPPKAGPAPLPETVDPMLMKPGR